MLCPEGDLVETAVKPEEEITKESHVSDVHAEGVESLELNTFKGAKSWKKSISNFFRHQLRSSKSNDGDQAAGNVEDYKDKDIPREQKWQSLGKIFRRPSMGDAWDKSCNQHGESSTPTKKLSVKKVISGYFVKSPKNLSTSQPLPDED